MTAAIIGSGGAQRASAQGDRLEHMAGEISRDLEFWRVHLPDAVVVEVETRIARHRQEASRWRAAAECNS